MEEPQRATLEINLQNTLEIAHVGVRRAAAFLKLGLLQAEQPVPDNLALDGGVTYGFWPNPIPPEVREAIRAEFRAWVTGAALKELDHYFSLFLDQVWFAIEVAELHGTTVSSSHQFDDGFAGMTNVAKKLDLVAAKLKMSVESPRFESLGRARNSLTHGAGQVRERDTNEPGKLVVRWIAPELVVVDGEKEIVYRAAPADMHQVQSPDGANVLVRFQEQSVTFIVGDKIRLEPHHLSEICFFYSTRASLVVEGLRELLVSRGIVKPRS